MPARATASRTTSAPSCGAVKSFRAPRNLPVGSRTALTMTASRMVFVNAVLAPGSRRRPSTSTAAPAQSRCVIVRTASGPSSVFKRGRMTGRRPRPRAASWDRARGRSACRLEQPHACSPRHRGADGRAPGELDLVVVSGARASSAGSTWTGDARRGPSDCRVYHRGACASSSPPRRRAAPTCWRGGVRLRGSAGRDRRIACGRARRAADYVRRLAVRRRRPPRIRPRRRGRARRRYGGRGRRRASWVSRATTRTRPPCCGSWRAARTRC